MLRKDLHELLQNLVNARGPCGQEHEVREVCEQWLTENGFEHKRDAAGNPICRIDGPGPETDAIRVMVHLDEISFIIKRLLADGTVKLAALGSFSPAFLGHVPVEIMGHSGVVPGVLSLGSWHTGEETPDVWQAKHGNYEIHQYEVITGMDGDALIEAGVRPGCGVVIARQHRSLWDVGDLLAGYALDNRAPVTAVLEAMRLLREAGGPAAPVYMVFTAEEELGSGTAGYASHNLPGSLTLAVDVAPVSVEEYGNQMDPCPVIAYKDDYAVYTRSVADCLVQRALELELLPGIGVFENYSSDASAAKRLGGSARAGLIAIPMENTHGYEIIHSDSIENAARLLAAYLREPTCENNVD